MVLLYLSRLLLFLFISNVCCYLISCHKIDTFSPTVNKDTKEIVNNKLEIIECPILFDDTRINLTLKYLSDHYGINKGTIIINSQMIVIHWTGSSSLSTSYNTLYPVVLSDSRKYIKEKGGILNVSAHYLVDDDGTIYQLMPDNWMARHIIGLNHISIGIENIGPNTNTNKLTVEQLEANEKLVRYLIVKYPNIEYLIGHMEHARFEDTQLYKENIQDYKTQGKVDPGKDFITKLRNRLYDLNLKAYP